VLVVAVFGSSSVQQGDPAYAAGVDLGAGLARAGHSVMTGGYAGMMEAVSRGAREQGGEVIGVTAPAVFPDRSGPNRYVTHELAAKTLGERIDTLIERADGFVVMEPSLGTLAELMVAWSAAHVAASSGRPRKPIAAVGPAWADLIAFLSRRLGADASHVRCVAGTEEAVQLLGGQST